MSRHDLPTDLIVSRVTTWHASGTSATTGIHVTWSEGSCHAYLGNEGLVLTYVDRRQPREVEPPRVEAAKDVAKRAIDQFIRVEVTR